MMSEKDMENIDEKENFDDDHISTETLHDICDGNQTHPNIDKREAHSKYIIALSNKIGMEMSVKSYAQDGNRFT